MSDLYKRTWKDKAGKEHVSTKWWGRYKDEKGKWQRVSLYRDKVASAKRLVELQQNADRRASGFRDKDVEALRKHARRPISEHVADYIQQLKNDALDEEHIRICEWTLNRLIELGGWTRISDITMDSMRSILATLTGQGKTVAYRNKFICRAKAFLNWLLVGKRIGEQPLAELKQNRAKNVAKKRARRPLEPEEVVALLDAAPAERAAVYRFLILTGLRRGELSQLRWGDLRLNSPSPFIYLRPEITKNGQPGTIPLHEDLRTWIGLQGEHADGDRLFRSVPDVATLKKDLAKAKIPFVNDNGERVDIHALRHTFCTLLALNGVSLKAAQTLMRHEDPELTANTYTKVKASFNADAMAMVKLPTDESVQLATGTHDKTLRIVVPKMSQNRFSACRATMGQNGHLTLKNAGATLTSMRPSTQVDYSSPPVFPEKSHGFYALCQKCPTGTGTPDLRESDPDTLSLVALLPKLAEKQRKQLRILAESFLA